MDSMLMRYFVVCSAEPASPRSSLAAGWQIACRAAATLNQGAQYL